MKKWIAIFLVLVLLLSATACAKQTESGSSLAEQVSEPETETETPPETEPETAPPETEPETEPAKAVNKLTGLPCEADEVSLRPYAYMINNMTISQQRVQTSLSHADLIIETYIEGYVTRLLAFYSSLDGVGQIGTIRSARIDYARLANAFDAIYIHVGEDPSYCANYLRETGMDDINFQEAVYWFREDNGLATEHTLYTTDELVAQCIADLGQRTTTEQTSPWTTFRDEADDQPPEGGEDCTLLNVDFSSIQTTSFHYDEETGLYERWSCGERLTDYKTDEVTAVKNVFVLGTTASLYEDGVHMDIGLSGGDGYYASEGKIIPIKWTTTESHLPVVTNVDGSELAVNAGTSYICLNLATYTPTWE